MSKKSDLDKLLDAEEEKFLAEEQTAVDNLISDEPLSPEEQEAVDAMKAEDAEREKYGDRPVETAVTSALGTASFGLSDRLANKVGFRSKEDIQKMRELNPGADIAGTLAGVAGPALLSGGTSAVAQGAAKAGVKQAAKVGIKAVGAPTIASIKAGKIVEKAINKALLKEATDTAAKNIVKKSVALGAGSAVEGAAFGTGQLLREDALGNAEFNAENFLANAGTGALYGGILGGMMPTIGAGVKGAKRLGKKAFSKSGPIGGYIKRAFDAEQDAKDLFGLRQRDVNLHNSTLAGQQFLKELKDFARTEIKLDPLKHSGVQSRVNRVDEYLNFQNKELNKIIDKMDELSHGTDLGPSAIETYAKLAKHVDEVYIKPFAKRGTDFNELVGPARILKKQMEQNIAKLQAAPKAAKVRPPQNYAKLQKQAAWASEPRPSSASGYVNPKHVKAWEKKVAAGKRAQRELDVINEHLSAAKIGSDEAAMAAAQKRLNQRLTASELRAIKQDFDKMNQAAYKNMSPKEASKVIWGARDLLNDTMLDMAQKVGGGPLLSKLATTQKNINYGIKLADGLKHATDAPAISMKDALFGTIGWHAGNTAGLAVVGAHKLIQSDVKKILNVMRQVEKSNKTTSGRIAKSVKKFVEGGKSMQSPVKTIAVGALVHSTMALDEKGKEPKNKRAAFQNVKTNLQEAQANPEEFINRSEAALSTIKAAAPQTAEAMSNSIMRGTQFLQSKLPQTPVRGAIPGLTREYEPSDAELARFERYLQVVENPMSVLEDLEAGALTRQHVEALQAVYPDLYHRIRSEVMDNLETEGMSMAFQKRIQLGILLDIEADPSMRGQAFAELQAKYTGQNQEQAEAQGQAPGAQGQTPGAVKPSMRGNKQVKLSERRSTDAQNVIKKSNG